VADILDDHLMRDHEDSHDLDYPYSLAYPDIFLYLFITCSRRNPELHAKSGLERLAGLDDFQ